MKGFAIHNAPTNHGGRIPSTQVRSSQEGNLFVRAGDGHFCPKCKVWSTVQPSHNHVIFDGKPVAYVDDLLSCGARILPQQSHVVGTSGGASLRSSTPIFQPISSQQNLNSSLTNEKNKEPCPPECVVKTYSFETTLGTLIISEESLNDILKWEAYISTPYVPGKGSDGKSGVTLGYGYDLGQQPAAQIKKDLAPYYTQAQINRLLVAQGKKGSAAQALVPSLSDITISKDKAYDMVMLVKKRYAEDTLRVYKDILNFHPHCQGAMLSLIYNRGGSVAGDRRKEMKQIQSDLKQGGEQVPALLRSMKRLWTQKSNRGLQSRREDEAKIFEKGLKCDCYE